MFSPEFDQVHNEAFFSATGRDFNDPDIQAEYCRDTDQTTEALLERWTDPEFDPSPITDFKESRRSQTFRIKHPETKNFTEEDALDIAKIRFFGRQVLKSAQIALLENPRIDPYDPNKFKSAEWRDAHPETKFDDSLAYDPDAASPQRLREWPEGEYMNCLGIAIAAAAESENQDTEYVFMNRIRAASSEAATDTMQFLQRLKKSSPEAVEHEGIIHELEATLAESLDMGEAFVRGVKRCMLDHDLFDYILKYAYKLDTSFHHSVIRKNDQTHEPGGSWQQFDPYGLVFSEISPAPLDTALSEDRLLNQLGACNEILLLDGDNQEYVSHDIAKAIDIAVRSKRRLEKLCDDYESVDFMEKIKIELEKSRQAISFGKIPAEEPIKNLSDEFIFDQNAQPEGQVARLMWVAILKKIVEYNPEALVSYHEAFDDYMKRVELAAMRGEFLEEGLGDALSKSVCSSLKKSRAFQSDFERTILAMPFTHALHFAEKKVKKGVFGGECEKAMEIGDPAFQAGSMYLNHYARWREDGIVNVASELARVNPSQLIWQSAISQEGGFARNDRVAAVGALIRSFKRGQKHPLVNITQKE